MALATRGFARGWRPRPAAWPRGKRGYHNGLESSRRLQHYVTGIDRLEPINQGLEPGGFAIDGKTLSTWTHGDVKAIL